MTLKALSQTISDPRSEMLKGAGMEWKSVERLQRHDGKRERETDASKRQRKKNSPNSKAGKQPKRRWIRDLECHIQSNRRQKESWEDEAGKIEVCRSCDE
jgi:hypothetical protein